MSESVWITIEGFSLGRYLDSNVGNDLFDNSSFGDVGNQYNTTFNNTAIIDAVSWATIVSDGVINITYLLGSGVDNIGAGEFINASITYDNGVSSVPVPAAIWLFVSGLMGLMGIRKKTKLSKLPA